MLGLVKSCIGTKFTSQFGDLIAVSNLISVYCFWIVILFFTFSTSLVAWLFSSLTEMLIMTFDFVCPIMRFTIQTRLLGDDTSV